MKDFLFCFVLFEVVFVRISHSKTETKMSQGKNNESPNTIFSSIFDGSFNSVLG